jgi:hypothetical protein
MKPPTTVVAALAAVIACIGIMGVVAPSVVFDIGRSFLTPLALYVVAGVRIGIGLLLLWVAPVSRMPRILRVMGAFIVAAGLLTPLFGVERSQAALDWWSNRDPLFVRATFALPIVFGLFLLHALGNRQEAARLPAP